MALKAIVCREHGGTFSIEARRGRPPVRCSNDNPCAKLDAMVTTSRKPSRVERVASEIKNRRVEDHAAIMRADISSTTETLKRITKRRTPASNSDKVELVPEVVKREMRRTGILPSESDSQPRSQGNPSLPLAMAAKAKLETVGWSVRGRGWREDPLNDANPANVPAMMAEITATRGEETIILMWQDGELAEQHYSLWHDKPSKNAMPATKLSFDPSEMSDAELVRAISGMKVTWWNSLAKSNESALIGSAKVTIEHVFEQGREESTKRIVKFVDRNGSGFRAFYVDALLKVG